MDKAFTALLDRVRNELRLTEAEFVEKIGIARVRWWRAKTGKVGEDARLVVLREAEAEFERMKAA